MSQLTTRRQNQGGGMTTRERNRPLDLFRNEFDTLIDCFFGGWPSPYGQDMGSMRMWDFDVTEGDKEIVVRAEMPGFEEKELDVQLNNDVLTIKAETEQKEDGQEDYRSFYRAVTLPSGIDASKVQACYHNGVLELHAPKPAGSLPKRIPLGGQQPLLDKGGDRSCGSPASEQGETASEKAK